ncbi:NADH-quinone oxidoreductase subunit C [Candidatus Poriferisodalis sp.]|uniref:NADH-quinone oxidoreductase subunit C n=1 Tax=Candidatus Poriferisodalis sp. TaxID=3101277 RepID=UPI003B02A2A6
MAGAQAAAETAAPGADATSAADAAPGSATMFGVLCIDERGQRVLHPPRDRYLDVIDMAAADGFELCVDVCAVDGLTNRSRVLPPGIEPERFEVVVNLLDLRGRRRLRLRVQVPADDPQLPSIVDRYPGAEAPEREVADLFGISFGGHPDPSRILMPPDWDGHPLRKDYDIGAIPVQFKAIDGR